MKSESVVLVYVVNLLSPIVSFWLEKGLENLCHRSSVKKVSCQLGDSKCESSPVTEFECEVRR